MLLPETVAYPKMFNNLTRFNMATFEKFFNRRNPSKKFILRYMHEALDKDVIELEDINSINLRVFKDYLTAKVCANSARTYCAVLKATINELHGDGIIPSNKCLSALRVKAEPQQNVDLSDEEIKLFENYYDALLKKRRMVNQAEFDVLTMFLCELFCGARGSDVENFTANNIKDGVLSYVSLKTHTLTVLPAHHRLAELIDRLPKRHYDRSVKNRIIKRVAKKIGITEEITLFYHGKQVTAPKYKFMAFHCSRRSFCGTLIDRGVPISVVSKMAGHRNTNMTSHYYVRQNVKLNEEAMSFFND